MQPRLVAPEHLAERLAEHLAERLEEHLAVTLTASYQVCLKV